MRTNNYFSYRGSRKQYPICPCHPSPNIQEYYWISQQVGRPMGWSAPFSYPYFEWFGRRHHCANIGYLVHHHTGYSTGWAPGEHRVSTQSYIPVSACGYAYIPKVHAGKEEKSPDLSCNSLSNRTCCDVIYTVILLGHYNGTRLAQLVLSLWKQSRAILDFALKAHAFWDATATAQAIQEFRVSVWSWVRAPGRVFFVWFFLFCRSLFCRRDSPTATAIFSNHSLIRI